MINKLNSDWLDISGIDRRFWSGSVAKGFDYKGNSLLATLLLRQMEHGGRWESLRRTAWPQQGRTSPQRIHLTATPVTPRPDTGVKRVGPPGRHSPAAKWGGITRTGLAEAASSCASCLTLKRLCEGLSTSTQTASARPWVWSQDLSEMR